LQPRTPLHEGLIAKVVALQLQQVEGVNARGHVPTVQQARKSGSPWAPAAISSPSMMQDFAGRLRMAAAILGERRVKSPPFRLYIVEERPVL
jgi:hypothetical protein